MRTPLLVTVVIAVVVAVAACGGKSKGSTPPGNVGGKGVPAPKGPVTVEMLQGMAKNVGGLAAFVDPASAVIDVHVVSVANDERGDASQAYAKPVCGGDAQALAEEARSVILKRVGDPDHEAACNTIEAPPAEPADPLEQAIAKDEVGGEACLFRGAAEYDLSYELYFRRDGDGRRLSRVQVVDVGSEINGDVLSTLNVLVGSPQPCK